MNLEDIQKLLGLIDQFKTVKRTSRNVGQESHENDAEHSYELAIVCWFLANEINRIDATLDMEKILKYALVHDLVEVYAGDTNSFDEEAVATKKEREYAAFEKIRQEFVLFPEMISSIENYEDQMDSESVFVRSVDKIQPMLASLREYEISGRKSNIRMSLDELSALKESKIKNKDILEIWFLIKKEIQAKGYLK